VNTDPHVAVVCCLLRTPLGHVVPPRGVDVVTRGSCVPISAVTTQVSRVLVVASLVVGARCQHLDSMKMGIGECQFTTLAAAADHPKWWLCDDDGGNRRYNVGRKMWWRVNPGENR
jgi:hypothetical protein